MDALTLSKLKTAVLLMGVTIYARLSALSSHEARLWIDPYILVPGWIAVLLLHRFGFRAGRWLPRGTPAIEELLVEFFVLVIALRIFKMMITSGGGLGQFNIGLIDAVVMIAVAALIAALVARTSPATP